MAFDFLPFLSAVFGWVYTLCWSLSFYPQPILNFRRRATSGTTVDFPLINSLGFFAYFVSNLTFFYSPLIRAQYAARHKGLKPTVQFNDIVFAAHAMLLSLVTTSQYLFSSPLWGFVPAAAVAAGRRPSRLILGLISGCVLGVGVVVAMVLACAERDATDGRAARRGSWVWLDAAYAVSYVKLVVTVVKYTPQAVANWRNRSTRGWSIAQVLLDLAGGLLSLAQLALDSYLQRDWSGVTGNPVKFALGNVSMVYDGVFMVQHYVLYRGAEGKGEEEEEPMLRDGADEEGGRMDLR